MPRTCNCRGGLELMQMGSATHTFLIPLLMLLLRFPLISSASALSFDYPVVGNPVQQNLTTFGSNTSTFPNYVELTIFNNDPQLSVGHLFNAEQLPLWNSSTGDSASFNCSFQFQILRNVNSPNNGDGLAFVLLSPSSPNVVNTSKGQWLGLFNDTTNGTSVGVIAIEFDTYQNYFDPNSNHIGIDINRINSTITQPDPGFDLVSNDRIYAWVDYSSSQSLLEVYATNLSNTKPSSPLLFYTINLTQYLPESVYIGFSASTGADSEYHRLLAWSFNSTTIGVNATIGSIPPIVDPTKKGTNVGLFVGLAMGIFIGLAVIMLLGMRHRKQRQRKHRRSDQPVLSGIDVSGLPSPSAGGYGPRKFNYKDLSEATRNFGENFLLGQGGFGPVYKGVLLEDGSEVAVKCISQKSSQGEKEFFAEVSIISRIRHKNLVQLKGWCREKSNLLLVYEYLPKGSLDRYLFSKSSSLTLDWSTRYNVVAGLGSALQYLHQECEKVIVHRDIKPSNVMLDTNFNAKLGDFGLARQLGEGLEGHTTLVVGTAGYMAPETYGTGRATPESDVYSYGIVLLEVACGRHPIDTSVPAQFEGRLLDWVWDLHSKGTLIEASDSRLGGDFDEEELVRTLIIGLACSHPDPKSRPSVRLALEALQGRVPLPTIPTFKPVAYYGPPPVSLFTTSSGPPISCSSSAPDSDLSERALLH